MIFEDLHWIDPTSRELLDLTVERITDLPVLLVATYRPEFQPPWVGGSQVTVIALNRLGRSERVMLVHRLAGNLGAIQCKSSKIIKSGCRRASAWSCRSSAANVRSFL